MTVLIGFLLTATGAPIPTPASTNPLGIYMTPDEKACLRDGDLILRKAPGMVSDYIVSVDGKSEYSHAGLVRKVGDQVTVIHASFDQAKLETGVHEENLDSFLTDVPVAAIYRLKGDSGGHAQEAVRNALALIGTPFDFRLDKDNAEQIYCTELLWMVYQRAGIDLIGGHFSELDLPMLGHVHVILPSDIATSSDLSQVMYLKTEP